MLEVPLTEIKQKSQGFFNSLTEVGKRFVVSAGMTVIGILLASFTPYTIIGLTLVLISVPYLIGKFLVWLYKGLGKALSDAGLEY